MKSNIGLVTLLSLLSRATAFTSPSSRHLGVKYLKSGNDDMVVADSGPLNSFATGATIFANGQLCVEFNLTCHFKSVQQN